MKKRRKWLYLMSANIISVQKYNIDLFLRNKYIIRSIFNFVVILNFIYQKSLKPPLMRDSFILISKSQFRNK